MLLQELDCIALVGYTWNSAVLHEACMSMIGRLAFQIVRTSPWVASGWAVRVSSWADQAV